MKLNKIITGIAAAGMVSAVSMPAQAAVLDAWQMTVNGGTTYTNIGRLSLTAGSSTVEQEVNSTTLDVFNGARFTEDAIIYSISYVQDNVVGPTDSGAPTAFAAIDDLSLFVGAQTGSITGGTFAGGNVTYSFDPVIGNFVLAAYNVPADQATGGTVGIGGSFANTTGFSGANGQSVIDIVLASLLNGFDLKDSTGTSLDISKILMEVQTNNQVGNGPNDVSAPHACSFDAGATCLTVRVNSNGDAFLTTVPEPATLALLGMGLLGMGVVSRRRTKA